MVTSPTSKKNQVRFDESLPTNTEDQPVDKTIIDNLSPTLTPPVPSRGVKQSLKMKVAPLELLSFPYTYPLEIPSLKNRMVMAQPRDLVLPTGLKLQQQRAQGMRCIDIINGALDCLESVD